MIRDELVPTGDPRNSGGNELGVGGDLLFRQPKPAFWGGVGSLFVIWGGLHVHILFPDTNHIVDHSSSSDISANRNQEFLLAKSTAGYLARIELIEEKFWFERHPNVS